MDDLLLIACGLVIAMWLAIGAWAVWTLRFRDEPVQVWVPMNASDELIEQCVAPYRKHMPRARIMVRYWTMGDCGGHTTHN